MQHVRSACMIQAIALLTILPLAWSEGNAAQAAQAAQSQQAAQAAQSQQAAQAVDNNSQPGLPVTTYTVYSDPQQGAVWVYAPASAGAQPLGPSSTAVAVSGSQAPSSSGSSSSWGQGNGLSTRRRRRRWGTSSMQPPSLPPGAASLSGPSVSGMPPDPSLTPSTTSGQPASTPAFIPGKGWATIVWQQPPGTPSGWAAGPPPPPGSAGQPGMGPAGAGEGLGPKLPGGTLPSGGMGPMSGVPSASPKTGGPLSSGGSWGRSGGRPPWRGSSSGGWASGSSGGWASGSSGRWSTGSGSSSSGGRPGGPWGSGFDQGTDDDDNGRDGTPRWPSMVGASPRPWGSSSSSSNGGQPGSGPDSSDSTSSRPPPWIGAGPYPNRPGPWSSPAMGSGAVRPPSSGPGSSWGSTPGSSGGMWPAARSSPRPSSSGYGSPVSGPSSSGSSRADPDRPWSWMRASPSPKPGSTAMGRPGMMPSGPGSALPTTTLGPGLQASPKPSSTSAVTGAGSMLRSSPAPSSGEWDEGMPEEDDDSLVVSKPPPSGPGNVIAPSALSGTSSPAGQRPSPSPSTASGKPGSGSTPGLMGRPGAVGASPRPAIEPAAKPGSAASRTSPSPRPASGGMGFIPDDTPPVGASGLDDSPDDVDVDVDIVDVAAGPPAAPPMPGGTLPSVRGSTGNASSAGAAKAGAAAAGGGGTSPGRQPSTGLATGPGAAAATNTTGGSMLGPGMGPTGNRPGPGAVGSIKPGSGPVATGTSAVNRPATGASPTSASGVQLQPARGRNASGGAAEAGVRAGSTGALSGAAGVAGTAVSTSASAPTSFTLPPTTAPYGGGAAGVQSLNTTAAKSTLQGPEPYMLKQSGAKDTILIGCALPFEGDQEAVGKAVHVALKMALQEIVPKMNPSVNVNLTCLNTKCLDIPAHNAMQALTREGAVAIIGDICSGSTVAASGVAATKQVPLISPAASSPQLSGLPFFFRTVPSDRYQGAAAASLARSMGLKSVGVVYEDASYGYGLAFNFIASFSRDGGSVPEVYVFKKFEGQPQQAADKMVAAKAANGLDGVFVSTNNLTFFADFLRAADKAKLNVPVIGGDAVASPAMAELLQDNVGVLKGVTATAFAPGTPEFQRRFKTAAPGVPYADAAAQGYDAMAAVLKAFAAAPPPRDARGIALQLPKQNFTGVSGPIGFDTKGDMLPHDDSYIRVTFDPKTGRVVPGKVIPLP